jgi:FkbM family methyltransferase
VVDVGAHIGVATICFKRIGPACKVVAYEPDAENFRMLRINTRRLEQVQAFPFAITDGALEQVQFGSDDAIGDALYQTGRAMVRDDGDDVVKAVGLEHALENLGHIDLVKIGCHTAVRQLLTSNGAMQILRSVRWVCGRLDDGAEEKEPVLEALAETHAVSVHSIATGRFFVAAPMDRDSKAPAAAPTSSDRSEHV